MERDNRDEDMMLKGTKQEMPGFRFRLLRPEKKRELWNPDFELLFLLRGSGRVSYEDGEVHNLPMGSIFAINRFQICDLDLDEDGLALSLCVSAETIASFHIKLLKCEVKCQSFFYMEDQQEKFDLIRRDMARIFLEMYKNNEEQPIYMKSRVTALLEDLLSYFTSGEKVEQGRSGRERLQRASDYILQHCREEITLEDLADHLYLSRAYISRSFPQYFGVSFREYVTQVRLAHAVQEMHSGATLTEIAYHNGFVNETAMIRAFRKYRGMTPSEYRKQMEYTVKQREKKGKEREEAAGDQDIFQSLLQYAAVTEQEIETTNESAVSVIVAVNGRKPRVAGHWKRVINAGYAASVLNESCDTLRGLFSQIIEDRTDILFPVKDLEQHTGLGFSAWCDNNRILIGTRRYMEQEGVTLPEQDYEDGHSKNGELQVLYLAGSGNLHAMFVLRYVGGRNVARSLASLQRENIRLLVTSKDPSLTARHITEAYHLPEGMVTVLDGDQCQAIEAAEAAPEKPDCCLYHHRGFASLTGGLQAADQAQNAETSATTVQLVSVCFSVFIAVLLTYAGSIWQLSIATVLMYQAAWSALSIAVCALKQHS